MAETRDVLILGGGHNGLVTAYYLAKAGFKPLVLERRAEVGGCAITDEIHPGFRCPILAHTAGPLRPSVVRDMRLEQNGLKLVPAEFALTSLAPDGRALSLATDPTGAAAEIAKFSAKDAAQYPELQATLGRMAKVLSQALALVPPDIDKPSSGDLWSLLTTGRAFRALGKTNMYRLLRWGPMAIADFASEWFENDLLRAAVAARGIFGTFLGPWSAGSTLVYLVRAASDPHPVGSSWLPMGGAGAITDAMAKAAQQAGADIRTNAEVIEIRVKDGAATGVVLSTGEEILARAVVSNADPKRTLLKLVDPTHLDPGFIEKLRNYRTVGTVAKLNLALSGLPKFRALADDEPALRGRILIAPEIDYIERAFDESKYGAFSRQPYLEVTIPSLSDPSLAPTDKHVMSIYMQYAPYKLKGADWDSQRVALADTIVKTLAQYAPNLPGLILTHRIITPQDMEDNYGLTGGHIFHGELSLDQFFTMRPLLGWARYNTPIKNLYLCGSGTHPGDGLTGGSGANAAAELAKTIRR
jgi:phytoene dehydrogenase-like protein